MIIADTSVWVDHIRVRNDDLLDLIAKGQLLHHPFVTMELALGSMPDRERFCAMLGQLSHVQPIEADHLLHLIVDAELHSTGIGMVDAHLLASAREHDKAVLWTIDKRLNLQAQRLGVAYNA